MWLARDRDGLLYIYENKPKKGLFSGWVVKCGWFSNLPSYVLPEIKWEDEEPRELVLKPINKKMDMKLAITIKKPCHPKCLYELTGDVYTTTKTYLIELGNLPKEVVNAINEVENEGCVSSISFVEEKQS